MLRKPVFALLSVSCVALLSTPAVAETPLGMACRAYAAAVADDYMSDELVRIDDTAGAREGYLTAHVAGHKFLIPVNAPGEGVVQPRAIGTRVQEWGRVYKEERRRCLRQRHLGEFTGLN